MVTLMLSSFLQQCCRELTHLDLYCDSLSSLDEVLTQIGLCEHLTELRLTKILFLTENVEFSSLSQLHNLERLDLSFTAIKKISLLKILKSNSNLKHLNIGSFNSLKVLL